MAEIVRDSTEFATVFLHNIGGSPGHYSYCGESCVLSQTLRNAVSGMCGVLVVSSAVGLVAEARFFYQTKALAGGGHSSGIAWIATWATSPQPSAADPGEPLLNLENQTVRERAHVSVAGDHIRIRLSNEMGSSAIIVGSVSVGLSVDAASVKPESIRKVTFGGKESITIPAGAPVLSDPVALPVTSASDISISLYFPKRVTLATWHELALKRAVVSQHGDHSQEEKLVGGTISKASVLVTSLLVPRQRFQGLVVLFGDSITDGDASTIDGDRSWPSDLVRRLSKTVQGSRLAVVNEGIVGNRLLNDCSNAAVGCLSVSGLARFDRDALTLPGVTHIVLFEGINDLAFPGAVLEGQLLADAAEVRTAEDVIDAYKQLISRAHARGIKIIGATLTPFEGVVVPGYYSESKEAARQSVNKWIRSSGSFEGVIDFDAVLRDPEHPSKLLARFASEDRLHPNDDGYQAMADAVDLTLFK